MTSKSKSKQMDSDYRAINLYTALWAMRIVLNSPHSTLFTQDADDFLKFAGGHLIWPSGSLEVLLDQTSLDEEQKSEIREIGFQESWLQFGNNYTSPHGEAILGAFRRLVRRNKPLINQVIKASLNKLAKKTAKMISPTMKNARIMQKLLGLSNTDCEILNFSGQMLQSRHAHSLAGLISTLSYDDAVHNLATMLGIDVHEVSCSLKDSSVLVDYRLLEVRLAPTNLENFIKVPVNLQACLTEPHENAEQMMLNFASPAKSTSLMADDYPHLESDRLALDRFLKGSREHQAERINIMLYGEPGTGKTEFAKVIAQEAGLKLYEVASTDREGGSLDRTERLASLRISQRFLSEDKRAILLFDEIEDIFPNTENESKGLGRGNSADYGKAWMNQTLESNPIPVIWVSNSIDQIDPAYLRRFSYHLEFRKPPLKVRHRVAEKYLQSTSVSRDFIQQVAQKSSLTPALIESAARVVSLSNVADSSDAERLASRVIQQCQSAMRMDGKSELRVSPTGYSLDYLNLDSRHPIEKISNSLKLRPTATMCFYGLPGTGKTALAEHLAQDLDRPLLAKRASDILGKYLGESEKNIANMFREAEAEGAILFLDEADSLLRNREKVTRSWEVSQVNELLQQMERFNGIFICATNLFADLDAAALRRFTFKISFKAMTPTQRERMFVQESLLGDSTKLDDKSRSRLHRLDSLVPGDFAVVKRQSRMFGILPKSDDFLAELEAECQLKSNKQSRSIGFTA
jgi:SpoVK/Ycf46/Vps4 family AAA+-type ATPase